MKHDNYRVTRFDSYKHDCIGRTDVSARQGYYVHADSASKAACEVAKNFPGDTFFDVQTISEDGNPGEPTRYHRGGFEVMLDGDRFILARFSPRHACMVEESDTHLGEILGKLPDHLCGGDDSRLSVCEVGYWLLTPNDPSDATPCDITTLYEVQHYADPSDEEDEDAPRMRVAGS